MKYTDEKFGLVTINFFYKQNTSQYPWVKGGVYTRDQTWCVIEIGEWRHIGMINRYYKDQPNRTFARKLAFHKAWKDIKARNWRKITKEDRTRIWNKLMESGIKLF